MIITPAIGGFFLVLALIFTYSGWRNRNRSPIAAAAHDRLAKVFALVGLGLILLAILRH